MTASSLLFALGSMALPTFAQQQEEFLGQYFSQTVYAGDICVFH